MGTSHPPKDIKIASKQMKGNSNLLILRECKLKPQLNIHLKPTGMARLTLPGVGGKCRAPRILRHSLKKLVLYSLIKLHTCMYVSFRNSPNRNERTYISKHLHISAHSNVIHNNKKLEQSKCLLIFIDNKEINKARKIESKQRKRNQEVHEKQ